MATQPTISPASPAQETSTEKMKASTAATEVPPSPSTTSDINEQHEVMDGALTSLLIGAFLPCIPIVLISAVLLSFILYNRVLPPHYVVYDNAFERATGDLFNRTSGTALSLKETGGAWAYHLWTNRMSQPGTLHTIASLTGKILPFVTSTSMALVAFFAGHRILKVTRAQKEKHMPTPHQMSILISLLNGDGFSPLWDTIKYRYQNHEPLVSPVPLAFWSLMFVILLTLAISVVDSWLGIAMQAVTLTVVQPLDTTTLYYGRQLNDSMCASNWHALPCPSDGSTLCQYPCSITNWTTPEHLTRTGLQQAQVAAEALMDNSLYDTIYNVSAGNPDIQHYFLGDIKSNSTFDYLADAVTVSTQCQLITPNCTVGQGFTCGNYSAPSFAWTGQVGVTIDDATGLYNESSTGIQFFNDTSFNIPVGLGSTQQLFASQNPISFIAWSKGFPPVDTTKDQFANLRDQGYLKFDNSGDPVFVLSCSMSVNEAKFNWTNGAVEGLQSLTLAPPSYGAIFSAPFAIDSALGHLSLQDAAALAAYQNESNALATKFANQFSQATVALSAGLSMPSKNILEQVRNNSALITRVPLVPLYLLVSLKALYALFALALAGMAVLYAEPIRSQEVKARLTIDGLATGLFEADAHLKRGVKDMQLLYEEHSNKLHGEKSVAPQHEEVKDLTHPKVGIVKNPKGGWSWASTKKLGETAALGLIGAGGLFIEDMTLDVNDAAGDATQMVGKFLKA